MGGKMEAHGYMWEIRKESYVDRRGNGGVWNSKDGLRNPMKGKQYPRKPKWTLYKEGKALISVSSVKDLPLTLQVYDAPMALLETIEE